MKYDRMSFDDMLLYVRQMDQKEEKLKNTRERILQEIKDMKDRQEILSWDEIASAIAYPKVISDEERVEGGGPDDCKLLHQAERINRIYRSQMEELFEELEMVETEITKHKFVNRCISKLSKEDRTFIEQFVKNDMTYEQGMQKYHISRSTLYRLQNKAINDLVGLYNA